MRAFSPAGGGTGQVLKFPRDVADRRRLFVVKSFGHPAKLHLGLLAWAVQEYTRPGDTIADPMAGVGSLLYAAVLHRNVILREVEPGWLALCHENAAKILRLVSKAGEIDIGKGDARLPWGFTADHLIFSPPYGCGFSANPESRHLILSHKLRRLEKENGEYSGRWAALARNITPGAQACLVYSYGNAPEQIGHWRGKRYWQAMGQIYSQAYAALRPGPGHYMILVIKDHIKNGERVRVADQTVSLCEALGFELVGRHERRLLEHSIWQRRRKEAGQPVVEGEDVLVFQHQQQQEPDRAVSSSLALYRQQQQ